jgi:hypothetical protein
MRSIRTRLAKLEEHRREPRMRYVVLAPGQPVPEVPARPGEVIYYVITGVPRGPGLGEER